MKPDLPVQIRPATLDDIGAILRLQEMSLRELSGAYYSQDQIESLVKDQARYRHIDLWQIVAYYQGHLVGFGSLSTYPYPQIGGLYVHPHFVRRGIGRQLLQHLEHYAMEQPHPWRILQVMSSLTAVPFYQKQGYRSTHATGFWTQDRRWVECQQLSKRLIPLTLWERWQPIVGLALFWLVLFLIKFFS